MSVNKKFVLTNKENKSSASALSTVYQDQNETIWVMHILQSRQGACT